MNRILKKFLQRGVDLSPVGVELREDNTNYFCTPKGASVFGWAGIDGIHFCFIRGFGEMVFSVSPMNTSPDYVHPVAENFTDFLRLILACGDVAAVEQAWMWNEAQFEAFLNENPTTQEQQQTLSEISEKMNLLPMEQPWTYIKNLQSSFDYSQIKYTEDYYDNDMTSEAELVAPEWKVYFDGDFWGHRGKDRAGKEIKLDKQFDWAGYHWVIPAAYSCSKGLVVDFCMRVDSESIRDFMKKWNLDWENDSCENFTREQQMQMEWENPLCFNFKPCLKLNEKILQTTHGCAVSFNPCLPDGVINELEAKWAIDHYGLDSTYGWVICRDVFPWGTKHHPEINKLFLTMEQQPGQVPGSHFKVHAPGDSFMFSHPVSGITHTLTVQEIEQQTVPQNSFGSDRWIYPTHYIAMSYTLTPEPMENISVFDCDEGDRPIEVTQTIIRSVQLAVVPVLLLVLLVVQMVRQQLYMEQIHKKNFMLLVLLCTLNRLVMMSSGVSCSMLRSLTKKHSQLSKSTLRTLRAHFYTLLSGVCASCEASFSVSRRKLHDRECCVTSFRQGGYTPLRR